MNILGLSQDFCTCVKRPPVLAWSFNAGLMGYTGLGMYPYICAHKNKFFYFIHAM